MVSSAHFSLTRAITFTAHYFPQKVEKLMYEFMNQALNLTNGWDDNSAHRS